jgi:uncharacterized protein YggE
MESENAKARVFKFVPVLVVLLSVWILVGILSGLKEMRYIGSEAVPQNVISVSGEGEVFAAPDVAEFFFSITASGDNVKAAQDLATPKIDEAVAALKAIGIDEKDIKTTDFSAYPRYEFIEIRCITFPCPGGKQEIVGYDVTQTITVKVRKVDDAGKAIDAATSAGATNVSGLSFTVDDEDSLIRDARKQAIEDAQAKAKELAKDLGVRLVRIVSFSEGGNYPMPYYSRDMALGNAVSQEKAMAPSLPTGENKIVSNVNITYEIR